MLVKAALTESRCALKRIKRQVPVTPKEALKPSLMGIFDTL
jgi:hypothetical protein